MVNRVSPTIFAGMISGVLLIVTSLPGLANRLSDLQPFLWENRLILVSANPDQAETLEARLLAAAADINDRDIVWFIFSEETVSSNYPGLIDGNLASAVSRRWHDDSQAGLKVVLIGKDGGSKLLLHELDLESIFITIDAMPMRQYEMQQKRAAS